MRQIVAIEFVLFEFLWGKQTSVQLKLDGFHLKIGSDKNDFLASVSVRSLKLALDSSKTAESNNNNAANFGTDAGAAATPHSNSSSSSSGSIGDILSRSVLSDTTEMTASNFVFVAKSKQCLLEMAREQKKRQRKEEDEPLPAFPSPPPKKPSGSSTDENLRHKELNFFAVGSLLLFPGIKGFLANFSTATGACFFFSFR